MTGRYPEQVAEALALRYGRPAAMMMALLRVSRAVGLEMTDARRAWPIRERVIYWRTVHRCIELYDRRLAAARCWPTLTTLTRELC